MKYRWLFLFSGALAFIASNAFTLLQDERLDAGAKSIQLGAVAISILSHFAGLFAVSNWMRRLYPGIDKTRRRIGWSLAIGVPAVSLLMILGDTWQTDLRGGDAGKVFLWGNLLASMFQALAISIFITGIIEAVYHYEQLLAAEREKEELQRLNLMAQYDSLKQQINPHFLFNSLNSLSSLIAIDPDKAEQFVEEMSGVYRYLLQSSREELTTLGAELGFLQSYLHLLKTRFGESFLVTLEVPENWHSYRIPPLTLQLLVENAVKHNEASSERPLWLTIRIAEGPRLLIVNNLQPKQVHIPSEKIGLANIIAKYRLLHQPEVWVQAGNTEFSVSLPLIQPVTDA